MVSESFLLKYLDALVRYYLDKSVVTGIFDIQIKKYVSKNRKNGWNNLASLVDGRYDKKPPFLKYNKHRYILKALECQNFVLSDGKIWFKWRLQIKLIAST